MTVEKNYIFFSYRSTDVAFVRQIAELLLGEKISVWLDEYGIPYNEQDNFQEIINKAIKNSKHVVFFISKFFFDSEYCKYELIHTRTVKKIDQISYLIFPDIDPYISKGEFSYVFHEGRTFQYSVGEILAFLSERGIIPSNIYFNKKELSLKQVFHKVQEGGFEIDTGNLWFLHYKSLFMRMAHGRKLGLTNEHKRDHHVLKCIVNGNEVLLFIEYDNYYGEFSESALKFLIKEKCKEVEDRLDRTRLKNENALFSKEVSTTIKLVENYFENQKEIPDFEHGGDVDNFEILKWDWIGTHIYSTYYQGDTYRHRLFSFRLPDQFIFRVYKLVLPHPQLTNKIKPIPVEIKFVFRFKDNLRMFFKSIHFCDMLVNSFHWVSELTIEEKIAQFENKLKTKF